MREIGEPAARARPRDALSRPRSMSFRRSGRGARAPDCAPVPLSAARGPQRTISAASSLTASSTSRSRRSSSSSTSSASTSRSTPRSARRRSAGSITRDASTMTAGGRRVAGLSRTGLYRVEVAADHSEHRAFLVAHDDDLEIGEHRGGLDEYAWSGVELSEVSVAVQLVDERPGRGRSDRPCPARLSSDRRVLPLSDRHQRRLQRRPVAPRGPRLAGPRRLQRLAALGGRARLRRTARPGTPRRSAPRMPMCSALLDRGAAEPGDDAPTRTGQVLVEAMRAALGRRRSRSHAGGHAAPARRGRRAAPGRLTMRPGACSVPCWPTTPAIDGLALPGAGAVRRAFCLRPGGPRRHGARRIRGARSARRRRPLRESTSSCMSRSWSSSIPCCARSSVSGAACPFGRRSEFETAVREAELFPTDGDLPGGLRRVAVADRDCFYPPRALSGAIPLEGLCFLSRDLCWGDLVPKQRQELLHGQLAVWQALFGVREFKFPDVMRSSVLPALTLPDEGGRRRRVELVASHRGRGRGLPALRTHAEPERAAALRAARAEPRTVQPLAPPRAMPDRRVGRADVAAGLPCVLRQGLDRRRVGRACRSTRSEAPARSRRTSRSSPARRCSCPCSSAMSTCARAPKTMTVDDDEVDIDEDEEQALDTDHRERLDRLPHLARRQPRRAASPLLRCRGSPVRLADHQGPRPTERMGVQDPRCGCLVAIRRGPSL